MKGSAPSETPSISPSTTGRFGPSQSRWVSVAGWPSTVSRADGRDLTLSDERDSATGGCRLATTHRAYHLAHRSRRRSIDNTRWRRPAVAPPPPRGPLATSTSRSPSPPGASAGRSVASPREARARSPPPLASRPSPETPPRAARDRARTSSRPSRPASSPSRCVVVAVARAPRPAIQNGHIHFIPLLTVAARADPPERPPDPRSPPRTRRAPWRDIAGRNPFGPPTSRSTAPTPPWPSPARTSSTSRRTRA